jgi:hypothetical protein
MQVMRNFADGLLSVLKITAAPLLYRHPYRTSAEGLRADWVNIGRDIENVMGRLGAHPDDGQRTE